MISVLCSRCNIDQPRDQFGPAADQWPSHRACKSCARHRAQVRRHGLDADDRKAIAYAQGGCAICGHAEPGSKGWVVDHDRSCCDGDVSCPSCRRGVVCQWCNNVLGYAFDRVEILEAAIKYLGRRDAQACIWHMPVACAPSICGREERADAS